VTTLEQVAGARPTVRTRLRGRAGELWQWRTGYLMLAPFMILFFVFTILPVLTSLYLSFTYFNMLEAPRWIGWSNYKLLFVEDDVFVKAVGNTFLFAVVTGPLAYFLSLFFAWLINQLNYRYRYLYVIIFYAPSLLAGIAVGRVWAYFLSGDRYGLLNNVLLRLGIMGEPFLWLTDVRSILPAVMIVSLWMSLGTGFLAFIAGLQNVPNELYEAGKVDGIRSRFQELLLITLPVMKPQLLFGAVMTVVASFRIHDVAVQLAGFPSHLYAAHTILTHLFDYAFIRFEMGYAAAISVVLFLIMFGLSRFFMVVLASKGE
jgi:multiple sugar transport system permease protein